MNKPDGISFVSFRFSHTDVATWMSNATAQKSFLDLHFEGYIQSKTAIVLHRLHRRVPDAIWNNVGGKLSQYAEYKHFGASNPVYEHCNVGSPAVSKSGRPKRSKPLVRPGQCIQHLHFMLDMPIAHCDVFQNCDADFRLTTPRGQGGHSGRRTCATQRKGPG